jgi:hypothetical protein
LLDYLSPLLFVCVSCVCEWVVGRVWTVFVALSLSLRMLPAAVVVVYKNNTVVVIKMPKRLINETVLHKLKLQTFLSLSTRSLLVLCLFLSF